MANQKKKKIQNHLKILMMTRMMTQEKTQIKKIKTQIKKIKKKAIVTNIIKIANIKKMTIKKLVACKKKRK